MHIVFTIAGLGAGGAERVLQLITADWVLDRQITIVSFDAPTDPIFHPFDSSVNFVRLNIPAAKAGLLSQVFTTLRRIIALRRTVKKLDPDVVISFLTKINVISLIACLGTKYRVIISERNNPKMQKAHGSWNFLLSCLQWRASAIVMQTRRSLEVLSGKTRERACVIGNPVERLARPLAKRGPPVLVAVGRLTPQKGFDLLIEAFAAIAPLHPDWTLRIWGEGELRQQLQLQIQRLGLSDRIELPGKSKDPAAWIAGADAFVFPSRYEGFGNALAEAAGAGLAVVSFDCPFGPSDIIDHDRTGLLVPAGNVEALSSALDRVMADEDLRRNLGAAARADIQRFAPDKIIAKWDALLDRVLEDSSGAR
ncbi:glycosyltransferase family 4 protein [Sphingopyxis kveilinensis]|uniref:glycosyltransferase family 4 protein n=1 Tax=Sphingopyxis kveilinensis TaxID=3114367 RepID=UPI0030CE40C2